MIAGPRGGERLAEALAAHGIRRIYSVPGDTVYDLYDSLLTVGIALVSCRTQAGAAFAASADIFISGEVTAAVLCCKGPGIWNTLPLLVWCTEGRRPVPFIAAGETHRQAFQGADPEAAITGTGALYHSCDDANAVGACVDWLFDATGDGFPRPAVLHLGRYALDGRVTAEVPSFSTRKRAPDFDQSSLQRIAADLAKAEAPLLLVGETLRPAEDALSNLRALADAAGAGIAATPLARGILPPDDPRHVDRLDRARFKRADAVLALGTALDWTMRWGADFGAGVSVHRLDWPGGTSAGISGCDIACDPAAALSALVPMVSGSTPSPLPTSASMHAPQGRATEVLAALNNALPPAAITVLDGGAILQMAERSVDVRMPWRRLTPGIGGHLGGGLAQALGAATACPGDPVVAILGDFAAMAGIADLETIVQQNAPVLAIVFDNRGIGIAGPDLRFAKGGERLINFPEPVQFDALMTAVGGRAARLGPGDPVEPLLSEALAWDGPGLLHVELPTRAAS